MPIKIPDELPAFKVLRNENIFVMTEERAVHQDIRALKILILNLMPKKIVTETQLLRLLGNSPLQVDIDLLHPETHEAKNTSQEHLMNFYNHFDQIKDRKYDGMIITGAPVEHLTYCEVDYWEELKKIMDWSLGNVYSTFHICWGAQAALYHHYNISKYPLDEKMFGVFEHRVCRENTELMRGFDDCFYAPHSRHTEVRAEDIEKIPGLRVLSVSEQAGLYIAARKNWRQVFVTGHSEYDPLTLRDEYLRDKEKGKDISLPKNYFPDNDPEKRPTVRWRGHAHLLYSNWLNYCVYQRTPYYLSDINEDMD